MFEVSKKMKEKEEEVLKHNRIYKTIINHESNAHFESVIYTDVTEQFFMLIDYYHKQDFVDSNEISIDDIKIIDKFLKNN